MEYKWYIIAAFTLLNIITYLYKLIIYKSITFFITSLNQVPNVETSIITFFIKLFLIHLVQTTCRYIIEEICILGLNDLFKKILSKLFNTSIEYYKKDINNKLNQFWLNITNIEITINKIIIEVPRIFTFIIFYLFTIYKYYPYTFLFILISNLFIVFVLNPFIKKQHKLQKKRLQIDMDTKNKLVEACCNIEYVKINCKETMEVDKISKSFDKYSKNKIKDRWLNLSIDFLSQLYNDFLILIIYSIGIIYLINNKIQPIDLIFLSINTCNFCQQIINLKDIYNSYKKSKPKFELIKELLDLKTENSKIINENKLVLNDKNVIFKNITFSYDGKINVINNVSFQFINNKINVLLGPNGSGKSTLIKLLLRFYELNELNDDQNKIFVEGIDIRKISIHELRHKIVFVSQEPYIFNETIMYNIKYGNENIPDEKIIELCDVMCSRNWLLQNKDKITGFLGKNISGGERKKIQLINAICRESEVIVFDEPTNTLDSNAIKWFNEFIKILKEKYQKTIVIITNDTRLIELADNIVDLNKNRL